MTKDFCVGLEAGPTSTCFDLASSSATHLRSGARNERFWCERNRGGQLEILGGHGFSCLAALLLSQDRGVQPGQI